MRRPWRSRPRRGFPAAPSWPSLSPQRGGCLLKTRVCGGVFFIWCGFACGICLECVRPQGWRILCLLLVFTVLLRADSARQAVGSFSLSVQAVGLRACASPLTIPASGSRRGSFVVCCGLTDRPDAPSLAQPSSSRLPCRAVLAFVLSSARRMPPENTRL